MRRSSDSRRSSHSHCPHHCRPPRRARAIQQVIESLEARRLLSYTYSATPGNDNLEITGDLSNGTTIRIVSTGASVTTLESVIFIHLLDGNDRVEVKTLFRGQAIVV